MYVTDGFIDENSPSKKLLSIIYKLSVSPSIINILIDLQMNKARQKTNYQFYFIDISIGKYNILLIEYHL